MQTSPLPNRIGNRLDELNRQINNCLKDIRQHLEELEKASQGSRSAAPPTEDFAQLLRQELEKPAPPRTGA